MENNINIFVYGSLRKGFFNYEKYLEGKVAKIKPAILKNMDLYHMPYKGYPAIIPGTSEVLGEIIVVNDYESTIPPIDKMEGFIGEGNPNNEYHKKLLEVELLNTGEKEKCYVYFYNKDKDNLFNDKAIHIPDGNWAKYMLNSK